MDLPVSLLQRLNHLEMVVGTYPSNFDEMANMVIEDNKRVATLQTHVHYLLFDVECRFVRMCQKNMDVLNRQRD